MHSELQGLLYFPLSICLNSQTSVCTYIRTFILPASAAIIPPPQATGHPSQFTSHTPTHSQTGTTVWSLPIHFSHASVVHKEHRPLSFINSFGSRYQGKPSFCILIEDILSLDISHEQPPPSAGVTPASCSKHFNWLNTNPMGQESLAVSNSSHIMEKAGGENECCCGSSNQQTSLLLVISATMPTSPPTKATSCTCKAPSLQYIPNSRVMLTEEVRDTVQTLRGSEMGAAHVRWAPS